MSTELAVTAVTETLRQLLQDQVSDKWGSDVLGGDLTKQLFIETLPLHKVRDKHPSENVLNLFLYRTEVNPAWRNQPLPATAKAGENGATPLAINLDYLITAYGEDDREEVAHYFLGQAMRIFNDVAIVPRQNFFDVLKKAQVQQQIDRVTVTSRALSIDDISKLWTVFQTQYHVSAGYLVTVLLIDSKNTPPSPLPVLKRGPDDSGFNALAGQPPVLVSAQAATGFPAVRLGEDLIITGQRLDVSGFTAQVRFPFLATPATLPVTQIDPQHVKITLPAAASGGIAAAWPAGMYSLALVVSRPSLPPWTTNDVPFALAPSITVSPTNTAAGAMTGTITATPQIHSSQTALVLWDDTQIAPTNVTTPADPNAATTVTFDVDVLTGVHRVRLRVDGVDSIPILRTNGQLGFDPNQSVTSP